MSQDQDRLLDENLLPALMEGAFSGVVYVDEAGGIVALNDRARAYLDCRFKDVSGMHICHLFPLLEEELLHDVLHNGDSVANYYVQNRTVRFAVNIEPVGKREAPAGAVIVLQKLPPLAKRGATEQDYSLTANRFFSEFQFASENFRRAIKIAKFAAQYDSPILFVGEDGTEIPGIAKCIHNESGRRKNGYAELDCNALSREQVSHLLFEQTSASAESGLNKAVSSIQGGTLFLSHVEGLSPDLQYRVGLLIRGQYVAENDIHHHPADIRIIASTDKNLKDLVRQNLFREDLYYSLSTTTVTIPPLRERGDDIIDLANLFVEKNSERFAKPVKLTRGAFDCIRAYAWPGNAQELDAFCRKVVLSTTRHSINEAFVRDALNEIRDTLPPPENTKADSGVPTEDKAAIIREALQRNGGNRTKTAADLGISKATLWRHMQKYGICG